MNLQYKVFESAAVLAERAAALANATAAKVRERAIKAGDKAGLSKTLAQLKVAGGELQKIAFQHGTRFVKENASIAQAAGKDLTDLTRSVYSQFAQKQKPARQGRKPASARKRPARKAA
jgi:hypothetical protein